MEVPFFDYKKFCKDLNYQKLVQETLDTGYLIGGPFIEELEEKVQEITRIKHCVTVGNATDAMEIIFEFLKLPIGSKVLVPAHTMLATASAAQRSGLIPIPVEVDENSLKTETVKFYKPKEKGEIKMISSENLDELINLLHNEAKVI